MASLSAALTRARSEGLSFIFGLSESSGRLLGGEAEGDLDRGRE